MPEPHVTDPETRLQSLDAYRGFVMLAMASGGFALGALAAKYPSMGLKLLAHHTDHVAWRGCSFWDLIQPSFMFIVGVAMPFSYATRLSQGQTWNRLLGHAIVRSLVLVALGVFLSSAWSKQTNYTFVNVLAQIGLGYPFVFLLLGRSPRTQLGALMLILVSYWALFAAYPSPGPDFDYQDVGVNGDWTLLTGFLAHWEKNANVAADFDCWFLNLFPRPQDKVFLFNEGGYATLNFIPSIATMLAGVLAGELLRSTRSVRTKFGTLLSVAVACLLVGSALDGTVCPIVKRIWTPSWVVYSTGWTCGMLAAFYLVIDVAGFRRWAFPLIVVGMNSIAIYVMAQLMKPFVRNQLEIHLGRSIFQGPYGDVVRSASVLLVFWVICYWMYKQKIFVKV
jgi:predicted acyltransferase